MTEESFNKIRDLAKAIDVKVVLGSKSLAEQADFMLGLTRQRTDERECTTRLYRWNPRTWNYDDVYIANEAPDENL